MAIVTLCEVHFAVSCAPRMPVFIHDDVTTIELSYPIRGEGNYPNKARKYCGKMPDHTFSSFWYKRRDNRIIFLQKKFSNQFSWFKIFLFKSKFHWHEFRMIQQTINQHKFKLWPVSSWRQAIIWTNDDLFYISLYIRQSASTIWTEISTGTNTSGRFIYLYNKVSEAHWHRQCTHAYGLVFLILAPWIVNSPHR